MITRTRSSEEGSSSITPTQTRPVAAADHSTTMHDLSVSLVWCAVASLIACTRTVIDCVVPVTKQTNAWGQEGRSVLYFLSGVLIVASRAEDREEKKSAGRMAGRGYDWRLARRGRWSRRPCRAGGASTRAGSEPGARGEPQSALAGLRPRADLHILIHRLMEAFFRK